MKTIATGKDIKTFAKNYFASKGGPFNLPLSDALHKAHDFFDLYPMDGGGGLFSRSIIPGFSDSVFVDYILNEGVLEEFGGLPHLEYRRFERWSTAEKSAWLNRFYFIVPLAKKYWAGRDEALARLLVETMLHFIAACPAPAGKDEILKHIRYMNRIYEEYNRCKPEETRIDEIDIQDIWFDFQPASRLLHWVHALRFLHGSPSIRSEEWEKIIASLYRHAEVIYYGEKFAGEVHPGNNHQSLRGLALVYAGAFFKGFGMWREFMEEGIGLINFHALHTFAADGSEIENSPSYHIFTAWQIRDAFLLARQHDVGLKVDIEARLGAAADFVRAVTAPDNMTVVLNDGYAINGAVFLKTLSFTEKTSISLQKYYFQNAGLVVYKAEPYYLLLDASPPTGRVSHYHSGKNAITLWVKGLPFLIDSGCAPYDEPSLNHWYKQPQAHSSLLVNGQGDGLLIGFCDWQDSAVLKCSGWLGKNDGNVEVCAKSTSTVKEWKGVRWQRCLEIKDAKLVVRDRVQLPSPAELTFIFNTHPDVIPVIEAGRYLLRHPAGVTLELVPAGPPGFQPEIKPGKCYLDFSHHENQQLLLKVKAGRTFKSEIRVRVM